MIMTPSDLRPEVLAFAYLMEARLRANDHKPGWKGDSSPSLLSRMTDERAELVEAIGQHLDDHGAYNGPTAIIAHEAADVANFAMMIADVCGAL